MDRRLLLVACGLFAMTSAEASPIAAQSDQQGIRETQQEEAQGLTWSRDPFLAGGAAADLGELTCSGILWDPQQPLALINGRTLGIGEEVEGYRVLEITRDTVTLSDGAQTVTLTTAP